MARNVKYNNIYIRIPLEELNIYKYIFRLYLADEVFEYWKTIRNLKEL